MSREITDEQLGNMIINFGKAVKSFVRAIFYGLGEIFPRRGSGEEKKRWPLIGFFILLIISIFIYFFSEKLVELLPSSDSPLAVYLKRPIVFKVLSIAIIVFYVKAKGYDRVKFLNSFEEKFETVGLHSRLVREKIDSNGKKIKVKDYPRLLKEIRNKKSTVYIFSSNGIPISEWRKKIPELESTMDLGILKIENKKNSKSVVKMVTVPYEVKAERRQFDEKFEKLGLFTRLDNVKYFPELLETTEEDKKLIYKLSCEGLPIGLWKDRRDSIESIFNTNVVKIRNEKDSKNILELVTVPLKYNIKEAYPWKDEYIPKKDFEVALGEGLLEQIILNFNLTPHVLIGGLTGAGKSVLERSIVWQVIKKGAIPFLVDFKGGIELDVFKDFGEVVSEVKRVSEILDVLVREHHARIEKFKNISEELKTRGEDREIKNIVQYNEIADEPMARVFFIVDEVAELLDKTGLSKDEKKKLEDIEGKMSTLARLSRASGINMILATQRPDAKVITGQIKNNLGARISGRMSDKEPSMMILGSPDAMNLPEDTKGRFLFSLGAEPIEFQGYYFKDSHIKKGSYQKGVMLVGSEKVEIKSNVEVFEDEELPEGMKFDPLADEFELIEEESIEENKDEEETTVNIEVIDPKVDDGFWEYEDDEIS